MSSMLNQNRFSPITPDDHAGSVWISTLLCLVYTALVVLVRAHLRRKIYGIDDYLILGSALLQLGEAIALIIGMKHGLAQSLFLLSESDVSEASHTAFAAQLLYILSSCLAKASTLCLMMRLFNLNGPKSPNQGRSKLHWWICAALLGVIGLWGIGSVIGLAVDCSAANFIRVSSRSQCPNQVLRWQIITAFDVATEALLVLVSVIIVIPVQLTLQLKFQVVLAFLFRLPLVAVAILRLYYVDKMTQASNTGIAIVPILVLQQVYLCWSIISATIPNLKSFVRSFGSGFGIGIDMETYTNAYGSRGSHRHTYELGSVKGSALNSRQTASRNENRSYNDIEGNAPLPQLRPDGKRSRKIGEGSIGSEDSQQHIIRKDVQWKIHYENNNVDNSNSNNNRESHPHAI